MIPCQPIFTYNFIFSHPECKSPPCYFLRLAFKYCTQGQLTPVMMEDLWGCFITSGVSSFAASYLRHHLMKFGVKVQSKIHRGANRNLHTNRQAGIKINLQAPLRS